MRGRGTERSFGDMMGRGWSWGNFPPQCGGSTPTTGYAESWHDWGALEMGPASELVGAFTCVSLVLRPCFI